MSPAVRSHASASAAVIVSRSVMSRPAEGVSRSWHDLIRAGFHEEPLSLGE
jgi:hypothetical protein